MLDWDARLTAARIMIMIMAMSECKCSFLLSANHPAGTVQYKVTYVAHCKLPLRRKSRRYTASQWDPFSACFYVCVVCGGRSPDG